MVGTDRVDIDVASTELTFELLNPYLVVARELAETLSTYKDSLTSQKALREISDVVSKNRRILEIFGQLQENERSDGDIIPYPHELTHTYFGFSDNAYQILDLGLRLLRTENPESVILDNRYAPRF
ncbi:MAG: hypothetical protein HYT70_02095 [Candidatus Aenigmarchaeota archaeon]|nr:hypothetical protein [Candidatus Aenigmarchaeota archaeon]